MTKILRLGEFAEVGAGNSAPQNETFFKGGTLSFVRTSDVGAIHIGSIETSRDLLTPEGAKGLKLQPSGTILFPKSGASTFLNHRVILDSDAYVSSHLATIKANGEYALDRYIFYFLQTIDARDLCQDQAYPSLNRDQIAGIEVPLPSLGVQQEIVGKLDSTFAEFDTLSTKKNHQFANSKEIFRAVCKAQIELLNPSSYVPLKELSALITKGTTPTTLGHKFKDVGINFIKVEAIDESGNLIPGKFTFIDDSAHKALLRSQLQENDVLVSITGALGRSTLVGLQHIPANISQNLAIVRLPIESKITHQYLASLFMSDYFELNQIGAGVAQQALSLGQIGSLQVPILTVENQARFINFIKDSQQSTEILCQNLNAQQLLFSELKSAILSNEFIGAA